MKFGQLIIDFAICHLAPKPA